MNKQDLKQATRRLWERGSVAASWIERHRGARIIINAAMILFVLVFVFAYVAKDWQTISHLNIKVRVDQIIWSSLAYGVNFLLMAQIWHLLIRMIGLKVPWSEDYELFASSNLARFLPSPIWYLASRTMLYERKYGFSKRNTLLLTVFETFLHFISGVAVYCVLLVRLQAPLTWLFLLGLLPVILVTFYPRQIFQFLANLKEEETLSVSPGKMIGIFTLYLVTWCVSMLFFRFTILITSEIGLPNIKLWEIWIIATLISYLSTYTLGGVGMFREFSLTLLLSPYFTPPVALMISVVVRLVMTVAGVAWSLLLMGYFKLVNVLNVLQRRERLE